MQDDYLELIIINTQKLAFITSSSLCWGESERIVTWESLFRGKSVLEGEEELGDIFVSQIN